MPKDSKTPDPANGEPRVDTHPDAPTSISDTPASQRSSGDRFVRTDREANLEAASQLLAGRTVIRERFVLEAMLGTGGMGTVYRARDLRKVEAQDRDPWVAIKLLNEDFKQHPSALISLQREARKSQVLTHPNIVKVFDFDRDGDTVYMTMELLRGRDLNQHISAHPLGIPRAEGLRLTREMGEALAHAHQQGIVHADFTPKNVFLTREGTAKVLDFGIAQAIAGADTPDPGEHTVFDPASLGAITPGYASLERLEGQEPTPADDVFGLGCIVYELLTGEHPHGHWPATDAAARNLKPDQPAHMPPRQWRALQRAMALRRGDRYGEVAEFLGEFLPDSAPSRTRAAAAVTVTLLLVAAGLYLVYSEYQGKSAQEAELRARQQASEALEALEEASRQQLEQAQARQQAQAALERETVAGEFVDWAETLIDSGQYGEAEQALERAREQAPDYPGLAQTADRLRDALALREQERESRRRIQAQVAALIEAIDADIEAGRLLRPAGNNAHTRYLEVIALQPDAPQAAVVRRELLQIHQAGAREALRLGQLDRAQGWLEDLATIAPQDGNLPGWQLQLEQARADQRAQQQARADALALLQQARNLLAEQPALANNFRRAESLLRNAERAGPELPEVAALRARLPAHYATAVEQQIQAGDFPEADRLLQDALLLAPRDERLAQLGRALTEATREEAPPVLPASF